MFFLAFKRKLKTHLLKLFIFLPRFHSLLDLFDLSLCLVSHICLYGCFYVSAPVTAVTGGIIFLDCPSYSCEHDISAAPRGKVFSLFLMTWTSACHVQLRCFLLACPISAPLREHVFWRAVKTKSCLEMWFFKTSCCSLNCVWWSQTRPLLSLLVEGTVSPLRKLGFRVCQGDSAATNGRVYKQIIMLPVCVCMAVKFCIVEWHDTHTRSTFG